MTEFERQLKVALEALAPPPDRDRLGRVMTDVRATRQRRGLVALAGSRLVVAPWARIAAVAGVAAVGVLVGIAIGSSGWLRVGVAPTPSPTPTASAPSIDLGRGWQRLPASPLSPRHSAHAFWVAGRVLVIGGSDEPPCPPLADCTASTIPPLRDGAALEPTSGNWTQLADAPVPLGWLTGAVVDVTLYVWVPGFEPGPGVRPAFLAYRVAEDRWEELPAPPVATDANIQLVAAGSRLVAFSGSHENGLGPDLLYDPSSGAWSELPGDPLAPSFDRAVVWTGSELVLLGLELVPNPGSENPSLYRAAALDLATGAWRRLPDSEVVGWNPVWFSTAGLVVNPSVGTGDGGQVNNWGRSYPFGGMLDTVAGTWSPLPDPPRSYGPYQGLSVGGDEMLVSDGWVFRVPTGTWTPLARPSGAADQGEAAVWAGDRLVVWGGARWIDGTGTLLDDGWAWLPPLLPPASVRAEYDATMQLVEGDATGRCFATADVLLASPTAEDLRLAAEVAPGWVRTGMFAGRALDLAQAIAALGGRAASVETGGAVWVIQEEGGRPVAVQWRPWEVAGDVALWQKANSTREVAC